MAWPHVFAGLSGAIPAAYLDDNFNAAALKVDFDALAATVIALPGSATPLVPIAAGVVGVATSFSRQDHQHPPQPALPTVKTSGYTILPTDDGKVLEYNSASGGTFTVDASCPVGFSCLVTQVNTAQVTMAPGSGATQRQRQGFAKTAGQWAVLSLYVRANAGSAAEYVLSGDMSA